MKSAVYPGTFDPITKGHLHLIRRASRMVDRLIIAVADNSRKGPLFSHEERITMIREDIANMNAKGCEIEVQSFSNLLVHFARDVNASCIIRGLRAVSDFEYEFQMAGMNVHLDPEVETVFLMASEQTQFVSSRLVKEICLLGGDITDFVPGNVNERLLERVETERQKNSNK